MMPLTLTAVISNGSQEIAAALSLAVTVMTLAGIGIAYILEKLDERRSR